MKQPHAEKPNQPETQLEIIPKSTAEKLEGHAKIIRTYINGQRKSTAETFGYAFLAGHRMLVAKEDVPHGNSNPGDGTFAERSAKNRGFKNWVEANFPNITFRSAERWMVFASAIVKKAEEKSDTCRISKTLPLMIGRGKINAKDRPVILEAVKTVMDGKGMLEFMRDSNLLRDPLKPTYHPRKPLDPEAQLAAEKKSAEDLWHLVFGDLALALPQKERLDTPFIKTAIDHLVDAGNELRELLKTRKGGKTES